MSKIYGNFTFTLTENGNLLGEYSNRSSREVFVEAAKRIDINGEGIDLRSVCGAFHTTWIEQSRTSDTVSESAFLTIRLKAPDGQVYELSWRKELDLNSDEIFRGEALIHSGQLIGDYQSV